jgi:hypothetical protein
MDPSQETSGGEATGTHVDRKKEKGAFYYCQRASLGCTQTSVSKLVSWGELRLREDMYVSPYTPRIGNTYPSWRVVRGSI